jgi:phage terminase large subunit GpA-like protein
VSLAETYEEKGEEVDSNNLASRAEVYPAQVPMRGVYLTAGVDMQTDRLEVETVAWGEGEESWSVDYRVLWGDPLAGDVWSDLDDYLAQTFQHESGAQLPIHAACMDTGGTSGYTQAAYEYLRGKTGRRLFGIKGVGGWGRPIVEKVMRKQSGKNARKVDLFLVGVDEAKLIVMRRLAKETHGPGYSHFPHGRDPEWYKQITAEKLVTRYVKGQPVREWHKPDKARNEALDCRVYALAALKILQPSMRRFAARLGVEHRPLPGEQAPAPAPAAPDQPLQKQPEIAPEAKKDPVRQAKGVQRTARVQRRGGWVRNY